VVLFCIWSVWALCLYHTNLTFCLGQTTNEHLRKIFASVASPFNMGPIENSKRVTTCCIKQSRLPCMSSPLPASLFLANQQSAVNQTLSDSSAVSSVSSLTDSSIAQVTVQMTERTPLLVRNQI
jgi:hypothetical protein